MLAHVPDPIRGDGPCGDCGGQNIIWYTDSTLWNYVIRAPAPAAGDPFLCVTCFVIRVDRAGLAPTGWRVIPDWHWETHAEYDHRRAADQA